MRGDLPSGTVTFLFTDVEGSTRLLHELDAEGYAAALAEHRRLIREACAAHRGVEVDTQGDAFFFAFPTGSGALSAAGEMTEALATGPIQVRVGLHTGEPLLTEEGYVGGDVHRAARIAAAGHGGQVLVSSSTVALLDDGLRDLGEHRFKDLAAPERVYQLGDGDFPSLKSLFRTNLPVPATPFLGRERELAEVVALLSRDDLRLLTLTGPGGTGKTRLALQAAAEAAERFPDGIWWVPLAPLREPSLLLPALAQALEVTEDPETPLAETLATALAGKQVLLLLDNAEHLLPEAADELAEVSAGVGSVVLVTSRERLQLQAERLYPVPTLAASDAAELFLARARALEPTFGANGAVTELCARLDNLPLALELAAARTVVFSPEQLLDRLAQRLDLLKGARDADRRQQTLRATIDWSYELLNDEERRLFRNLSVFAGGCTYEAAEEVCDADPDTLQSLLDKSLVRRRDTDLGPRYWMLETIREHAADQLESTKESEQAGRRHTRFFLELAERAAPALAGPDQRTWLEALERDHDNLRSVLRRALDGDEPDDALRLAGALGRFWYQRDHFREGGQWLDAALVAAPHAPAPVRAKALWSAGILAHFVDDQTHAESLYRQSAELFRSLGDLAGLAGALNGLGNVADERGEVERAVGFHEEALSVAREAADEREVRLSLHLLGERALRLGQLERAQQLLDESIALARRAGDTYMIASIVDGLGAVALASGDARRATQLFRELLQISQEAGFHFTRVYGLAGLAASAALQGDLNLAGRLWGAFEAAEYELGVPILAAERGRYERPVLAASAADPKRFGEAVEEGRAASSVEVMELALGSDDA